MASVSLPQHPKSILHLGDVVMAVGAAEELDKMTLLLGERTDERMDVNAEVLSVDVEVMDESLTGKTLASMRVWEQFTVVITRIRRQGLEIAPHGNVTLEMGDGIRVVGEKSAVEAFAQSGARLAAPRKRNQHDGVSCRLVDRCFCGIDPRAARAGRDGETGHGGRSFSDQSADRSLWAGSARFRLYVPPAAKNLTRELGLMLFLAGAGTNAGAHLVDVLQDQGWILLLAGASITLLSALAGLVVMIKIYKLNLLSAMGSLTAAMTNPPALASANNQTETDLPSIAYASTYPVALIFKILLAQALVEILSRLL